MIPLNYHQLYYFWSIAKAGSFKAATKTLMLAQPTLSLQISQLEKSLNARLFNRDRRGVSLTPRGRAVYEHCERIFTEGEVLAASLKTAAPKTQTFLRLGVQESISAWIVLRMIDAVTHLDTDVRVSVFGGSQAELQERLRRHALDVVVTNFDYSAQLGTDFGSRLVATIPISIVGTPKLRRKFKKFPQGLTEVPLLVRTPENPIRRTVDAYLQRCGVRPKIEIEIENSLLIRLLALQGRGAAVIDTLTVADDLKARRLVKLHAKPTRMQEYVWLLFNTRPKADPGLNAVIEALSRDFQIRV